MPVAVCPNCSYDTRGLPSNVCPECGQPLPEVAPPPIPRLSRRIAWGGTMIAATFGVGAFVTMGPQAPDWWCPMPLTVLVPWIAAGPILGSVPIIIAAAFLSIPVVLGRIRIPRWTAVPTLGIIGLSSCHFAFGFSDAVFYEGRAYAIMWGSIQTAITITLTGLWLVNRRRPGYFLVLLWHLLVSLWLVSYAFPFYGGLA